MTGKDVAGSAHQSKTPLVQLQSKDHEEILDIIDQLRFEGISKYVNLPQLIVCGDQSSGKSSVLEAISGLSFPTRDNVCTRFATELILRRAPSEGVTATIIPDSGRQSAEQARLRKFKSPTLSLDRFGEIVKSAEETIGVGQESFLFSKDVLRVEVSGPSQPHLTLVDLPGLYHSSDERQSEEGVAFVESLVLSYMKKTRSVMLAVISAKADLALQKVTSFTRQVDGKGERTLGIITKPDTLPKGSEMEQSFLNLAQNKRVKFRLGWHVLKNRTYEERDYSLAQRDKSESEFLSQGIWSSLPPSQAGIETLRSRLSTVLKDHILSQMPSLTAEARAAFKDAQSGLQKLGEARATLSEQRQYLFRNSERFAVLMGNAINGVYFDPYFGDALDDADYEKRLRAVVQNRLTDFSDDMRDYGEFEKIVENKADITEARQVCREDFVQEVRRRTRRSRGLELPGTFNPLIIGDLFFIQSRPWEKIVGRYIDALLDDARRATISILREVLDKQSLEGVLAHVVNPRFGKLEDGLRTKAAELLRPQQAGHPITYNHYFVETVLKARDEHLRNSIAQKLKTFFGKESIEGPSYTANMSRSFQMNKLLDALGSQTETDMECFACSEAIDCMLAYYKVAIKKFVDDFSSLAIEKCLLDPLLTIFGPGTVEIMAGDVVRDIASEDERTTVERDRLTEKKMVLEKALARLQRLDRNNLAVPRDSSKVAEYLHAELKEDTSSMHTGDDYQSSEMVMDKDEYEEHSAASKPTGWVREKKQAKPEEELPRERSPMYEFGTSNGSIGGFGGWPKATPSSPLLNKKKKRHPSADLWEKAESPISEV